MSWRIPLFSFNAISYTWEPLKFLCRTELHALIVRYGCAGTEQHYWHFCNVSKTVPNCTEFWDRSPNVSCQNINSRLLQKWFPYSLCIYYLSLSLFGAHIQTSCSALALHGGRTVLGCAHLFLRHVVISSEGRLWILLPTSVSCRLEEPHLHHTFPLGVKNRLSYRRYRNQFRKAKNSQDFVINNNKDNNYNNI